MKTPRTSRRWRWIILNELKNFKLYTTRKSLLRTLITSDSNNRSLKRSKSTNRCWGTWKETMRRTFSSLKRITRRNLTLLSLSLRTPRRQLISSRWCMKRSFHSKRKNMRLKSQSCMRATSRKLHSWLKLLTMSISSAKTMSERDWRLRRRKTTSIMLVRRPLKSSRNSKD